MPADLLLNASILVSHVSESLLLLGIVIMFLAMFLLLLPVFLFLYTGEENTDSLSWENLLREIYCKIRIYEWIGNYVEVVSSGLTASLACLSFSLSARTLCCSALSARRFSCTHMQDQFHLHPVWGQPSFGVSQEQARVSLHYIHSRFCWRGKLALLLPSSSEGSGPRSDTAAQTGPCPGASCVCPAVTPSHEEALCVCLCLCVCVCVCLCVCVRWFYSHQSPLYHHLVFLVAGCLAQTCWKVLRLENVTFISGCFLVCFHIHIRYQSKVWTHFPINGKSVQT